MSKLCVTMGVLVCVVALGSGCINSSTSEPEASARGPMPSPAVARPGEFDAPVVHEIRITVSEDEYARMEPKGGGLRFGMGFGGGPTQPETDAGAQKRDSGRRRDSRPRPAVGFNQFGADSGAGRFGYEFDYIAADIEIDGIPLEEVGLRYKGNGTYMMAAGHLKRSFKIDFDRHRPDQKFFGMAKLNCNCSVMDPTRLREALAYELFRSAAIPAPRTAFAEIELVVPGRFDGEYLGFYTLVEQVDRRFLKRHFESSRGMLLKPEGIRGIPYFGEDIAAYQRPFNSKWDATDAQWRRLIDFARLIHQADDAAFGAQIGTVLDVEEFLRFVAVNTLLASFDGFIGLGHNYYLYLDPGRNQFVFFPWDLDLAFGAFPMIGSSEELMNLSIEHPHQGDNRLIDRLFEIPEHKATFQGHLRQLIETVFNNESFGRRAAELELALDSHIRRDQEGAQRRNETGAGFGFGFGGGIPQTSPAVFVAERHRSVEAQLAGRQKGYVPAAGWGRGGGFRGRRDPRGTPQ